MPGQHSSEQIMQQHFQYKDRVLQTHHVGSQTYALVVTGVLGTRLARRRMPHLAGAGNEVHGASLRRDGVEGALVARHLAGSIAVVVLGTDLAVVLTLQVLELACGAPKNVMQARSPSNASANRVRPAVIQHLVVCKAGLIVCGDSLTQAARDARLVVIRVLVGPWWAHGCVAVLLWQRQALNSRCNGCHHEGRVGDLEVQGYWEHLDG